MNEELDESDEAIIKTIADGTAVSPKAIGDEIGEDRAFVWQRLRGLQIDGYVEKVQRGVYQVVDNPIS
jgi:biotin operon repressor